LSLIASFVSWNWQLSKNANLHLGCSGQLRTFSDACQKL